MTTEIDVTESADERRSLRLVAPRRLVFVFVVLAAALVAFAALGAANDWWFLKNGGAPVPATAPQVVKEGEWNGHPWQLVAYPSATHGLCVSITPKDSGATGAGGAASCGPFVGFERTPESRTSPDMTITLLAGGGSENLPAYIAGPVIEQASVVEVRFGGGNALRLPTFAGPGRLEHVRFYAEQLPTDVQLTPGTAGAFPKWVAGFDASGNVVACLAPQSLAKNGVSSLSDCR
jgi:hypothetical protein